MNVTLATSLHLDHGALSRDQRAGDTPPMQSFVPLGLLCLKAAAVEAGVGARIRVTELNGLINQGKLPNDDEFYDRVVDAFFRQGDDVAGLMTDADSLPHTLIFAERIRRRSPHTLICLGGPASSAMSRLLLERFPAVDFVVRGEGEATFTELLRRLETGASPAELLGLSWRDRGEIRINPDRPVIENLDELPIPDFECDGVSETSSLYRTSAGVARSAAASAPRRRSGAGDTA